ncbi:MAG: nitroreductase family protein [bacterium]|nr:nitroreductase family protein [bacterium]MDY3264961.1 nitroreductase family protein [Candidatus Enterosoma sp.]
MELQEAIQQRKSVRSYENRHIEREKLEEILNACILTPTGKNRQPLFYVILQDEKKKEELLEKVGCKNNYYGCDAILFVIAKTEDHLNELNCGAAIEQALLTATSLGLGSCWIHSARALLNEHQDIVKEILDLPPFYEIMETVALGYEKGETLKKEKSRDGSKII